MDLLGINFVSASSLKASLVDMEMLQEITGFQRNRIFILGGYVDIFRDEN